ncbi:MAG: DNA polymerase III epsilon subunit [Ignavibacteria bacterium]|nr:MAG: DNA polymerase III epsilon subunit [Ignavibacteria bacterium]KAF0159883.1 MAG: DNA polymerase III epsilon subunit [Ignavibacteria bacterium]
MKKSNKIESIPFEEAVFCVFDFETTGTSARTEKVIEIGMTRIKKGKIVDTFSTFINPGRPVPFYITKITGITNSDVQDAPYFDEVYSQIKNFIGNSVLVAHNLGFDLSFLRSECLSADLQMVSNDAICTLKLARKIFPALPSKSLGNIVKHFKIRHRDVHRGLGDAAATSKVLIKMFNTLRDEHNIDTIEDLISFQSSASLPPTFNIKKKKLADDLLKIPPQPGVYFFKNAKGEIIYIGKAKSLKERVRNHFMSNAIRKSKKIVHAASSLEYKTTNSELTALLAEAELIKLHKPKFNTLLKNFPRSYFVKITSEKFPLPEIASAFEFDGNDYYGPYPNRNSVTETKEIVDKAFQLRECNEKEFSKKRKCYLMDIQRCTGPCIEAEIENKYNEEIKRVHDFLSGQNQSAVDRLLNKMKELSEKQKFEEAAQIRDVVQRILNQLQRSSILSEPLNKANVLVEVSATPKNEYVLLLEGKMFFRNFFIEPKAMQIEEALQDFFEGSIQSRKELSQQDLERLKIGLSWLIKNRGQIKIHYLKNYTCKEELGANFIFSKGHL